MRRISTGTLLLASFSLCLAIVLLAPGSSNVGFAADSEGRPLDLPSGGSKAKDSDPGEEPLVGATFFGTTIEADVVHFCFCAYSTTWVPDGTFQQIQAEVIQAITELENGTTVSATSYDCYEETTPPINLDPATRQGLIGWVQMQETMGIQHVLDAALAAIDHANTLAVPGQRIVIVARGIANDLEALPQIAAANLANSWPIDVVYLESPTSDSSAAWMQFAAEQGGEFHLVVQ